MAVGNGGLRSLMPGIHRLLSHCLKMIRLTNVDNFVQVFSFPPGEISLSAAASKNLPASSHNFLKGCPNSHRCCSPFLPLY